MQQSVRHAMMMMIPIFMVLGIIALAIILIPFWFICKKAGFSPWLSLLYLIPLGNLVLYYLLAFADWKVIPAPQCRILAAATALSAAIAARSPPPEARPSSRGRLFMLAHASGALVR